MEKVTSNGQALQGELKIIRVKPFDPANFLGRRVTIWRGPVDGDGLSGEEDVCPKSLALTEVELSKFVFKTCLEEGESPITGEERIRRLRGMSDFIGFGPNILLSLWEDYQVNNENSALEWLFRNFRVILMDFPGVVLRGPGGGRRVLCLCRFTGGEWHWLYRWLGDRWVAVALSAGCASST